jgi:hypothetical protein
VLVLALALALVAEPALAAPAGGTGTGTDAGQNLGRMLKGWAQDLILPFAALGGIGAYFKRDVGMAFSLLIITTVIGAFAYTPETVKSFITHIWNGIA